MPPIDLSLIEADVLEALEQSGDRAYTAAQLGLACRLEIPRVVSVLTTLRRFGLTEVHVSGLGVETRWRITGDGRAARRRYRERRAA